MSEKQCIYCSEQASFLCPSSTNSGATITWIPVCAADACCWWEGIDWGPIPRKNLSGEVVPDELIDICKIPISEEIYCEVIVSIPLYAYATVVTEGKHWDDIPEDERLDMIFDQIGKYTYVDLKESWIEDYNVLEINEYSEHPYD